MIRLIDHKDIDRKKWDQCIYAAANGNIYNLSWYLDICSQKWDALVWGDYEVIMPLPFTKKAGVKFLYLPFFIRYIGIFSSRPQDQDFAVEFLSLIPRYFKKVGVGMEMMDNIPVHFKKEVVCFQELPIQSSYENIFSSYSTNAKRIIKKGISSGVSVRSLNDPAVISDGYEAVKGDEVALRKKDYNTLKKLMKHCLDTGVGEAWGVFKGDELLSGAIFLNFKNRITYLKGFSTQNGRDNGAMFLIMDHIIKIYSGKQYLLDFGGSKIPSIAGFFKKFGAVDHPYLFLEMDHTPVYYRLLKKLAKLAGK